MELVRVIHIYKVKKSKIVIVCPYFWIGCCFHVQSDVKFMQPVRFSKMQFW
jgi:hypothetical protein